MGDWSQQQNMRAFLVFVAISAVSGDAKPYTVAQVAAGLPVQNAVADGRLHNIGVITNAVQAGVKTVGALPLTYAGYPYLHYYGKREAEPYTLGQVAAGLTAGGVVTGVDYGHGSGLVPATGVSYAHYAHPVYAGYGYHLPYYG